MCFEEYILPFWQSEVEEVVVLVQLRYRAADVGDGAKVIGTIPGCTLGG